MHFSWPVESTGLSRLEASSVPPEAAPRPITVWISSMNRIAFGLSTSCFSTAFRRGSKSPRVLGAGQQRAHVERVHRAFASRSGTLPSTMRRATLRRSRSADAASLHEQRVVLAAAAERLHHALELPVAAISGSILGAGEGERVQVWV